MVKHELPKAHMQGKSFPFNSIEVGRSSANTYALVGLLSGRNGGFGLRPVENQLRVSKNSLSDLVRHRAPHIKKKVEIREDHGKERVQAGPDPKDFPTPYAWHLT